MARFHLTDDLKAQLRTRFGFKSLRPGQGEVIESILEGHDTLAILPTGAGKSLCYQLPSLALPGMTVVVSPLLSLMHDQAGKVEDLGIEAREVNSSLTVSEEAIAMKEIRRGESELVFVTPERLTKESFLNSLAKKNIGLVVIDEAHCLSQWGHDFRPAYLAVGEAIRALGSPPVLALTATATEEVAQDIQKQLGLKTIKTVRTSIYRSNLRMEAQVLDQEAQKKDKILEVVRAVDGTGIIYVASIRAAEQLSEFLKAAGIVADRYHGKLKTAERTRVQDEFMSGKLRVVVATQAFGLGIDKPDVRFVIHYQFPGTLEAYYQEAGRAGRDGQPARCVLLYLRKDKSIQSLFLAGKYPERAEISAVYSAIQAKGEDAITLRELEDAKPVAKTKIRVILAALKQLNLIKQIKGVRFQALGSELTQEAVDQIAADYVAKDAKDHDKLKHMIMYAQSARCRWQIFREYFSESGSEKVCGHCDRCTIDAERAMA